MSGFSRQLLVALRMLIVMTVLVGVIYPLAIFAVGRLTPGRADGSWVRQGDTVVGSALIGQDFSEAQWFHPRPSAAGDGYDALSSGGSNLAADNPELVKEVAERKTEVATSNGVPPSQVPADAVTASGSGLDPDISPQYAELQAARVARARGLDLAQVRSLIGDATQDRVLGFIGEPRVNVVQLNLALAQL